MQADTTVTNLCWIASLITMPYDVLVDCILGHLPVCALVACHIVCKGLCNAAKKALENASYTFIAQTTPFLISCKQQEIILSSFEHGSATFLYWIETVMKYPLFASDLVDLGHCQARIVARGDISMVKYFWDTMQRQHKYQNCYWPESCLLRLMCATAARHGHLHILQWAHSDHLSLFNGNSGPCHITLPIAALAASAGHLAILEWLHENAFPVSMVKISKKAAANGHIAVLEWVLERTSCDISDPTYGNISSTVLTDMICISSCSVNDTNTFRWALSNGFGFPAERCLEKAMLKGKLYMAEYIRTVAAGMSPPPNLIPEYDCLLVHNAVKSNSIETLRWLHDQVPAGYFQSRDELSSVVRIAAELASLEVLQWTLANGYEPSENAIISAVMSNRVQNLRWMLQDGRFVPSDDDKVDFSHQRFLEQLDLGTVQTLVDHGVAVPTKQTLCKCKIRQTTTIKDAWIRQRISAAKVSSMKDAFCFE